MAAYAALPFCFFNRVQPQTKCQAFEFEFEFEFLV
jgi:hypothetical protein